MDARAIILHSGAVDGANLDWTVPWWSFTKTVLATALMRLAEQGLLDLDACIEGERYTPAQLLRHEAGLADYGGLPAYHADVQAHCAPWPTADLLRAAEADRLRYTPGEGWAYSNIGYLKVGQLIEQLCGCSLSAALAELVFQPAGITTARLAKTADDLIDVQMGAIRGYHPGWVYHGLIVGTVSDAARLLHVLLNGSLVTPQTLTRMCQRRALPAFRSERHPDPAYGLGLMLSATDPFDHPIGHTGQGPGSHIAVYTGQGITCAIWSSTDSQVEPESAVFSQLRAFDAGQQT